MRNILGFPALLRRVPELVCVGVRAGVYVLGNLFYSEVQPTVNVVVVVIVEIIIPM